MTEELKPCPFCDCDMAMKESVNYPSPDGHHEPTCPLIDLDIAATEEEWNTRAPLSPTHIEDGEEVEVVGHLLLCAPFSSEELGDTDVEWDAKVAERLQRELATSDDVSLPLMTVAQHQRIVDGLRTEVFCANSRLHEVAVACATAEQERDAALSAPPAAGVPEEWREDVSLAAQMLTWGDDDGGLTERQIGEIEQHAKKLFAMLAAAPTPPASEQQRAVVMSAAATDVLAERRRQVEAEQWTLEHDDEHDAGVLAAGAAAYALNAADQLHPFSQGDGGHEQPSCWPWAHAYWKPGTPRRDLIKAGALILAEIERIDRGDLRLNPHLAKGEGV